MHANDLEVYTNMIEYAENDDERSSEMKLLPKAGTFRLISTWETMRANWSTHQLNAQEIFPHYLHWHIEILLHLHGLQTWLIRSLWTWWKHKMWKQNAFSVCQRNISHGCKFKLTISMIETEQICEYEKNYWMKLWCKNHDAPNAECTYNVVDSSWRNILMCYVIFCMCDAKKETYKSNGR